jgi:Uncharacterised nucleotidyltransferase
LAFTRALLYNRHRLSHRQINDFLKESGKDEPINERIQQMELVREFLAISDVFVDSGIEFLSLKGPLLSYQLYNDPTYRCFRDLDFLMDLSYIDKANRFLIERGYQPVDYTWPTDKRRKELLVRHTNQVGLYHPEKNCRIELHWKLLSYDFINPVTLKQIILSNQNSIQFAGQRFVVFNPEFELLYLIIHGGLHFWHRLKWLVDVHEMLNKYPVNNKKFIELAEVMKAGRLVDLCNVMLQEFYPGQRILPKSGRSPKLLINFSLKQIRQKKEIDHPGGFDIIRTVLAGISAFPGSSYKISVIREVLLGTINLDNNKLLPYTFFFYLYKPIGFLKRRILSKKCFL